MAGVEGVALPEAVPQALLKPLAEGMGEGLGESVPEAVVTEVAVGKVEAEVAGEGEVVRLGCSVGVGAHDAEPVSVDAWLGDSSAVPVMGLAVAPVVEEEDRHRLAVALEEGRLENVPQEEALGMGVKEAVPLPDVLALVQREMVPVAVAVPVALGQRDALPVPLVHWVVEGGCFCTGKKCTVVQRRQKW